MNLAHELQFWYRLNKRDLPWRSTKDPYKIWISEIILQQTRVDQGLSYYLNFVREYPDIRSLARASQDQILKLWQGLGYYSRARNMHNAANAVVNDHNGNFPDSYEEIRDLKGIGDYTAAAVASFAFDLPYPVIDGNVYRFYSRLFGISTPIDTSEGKAKFREIADKYLNKENPGEYNQAVMEFGAIVCTPKKPACDECIFKSFCVAFKEKVVLSLPVKKGKVKQRMRYFNYIIIRNEHGGHSEVIINKRSSGDIWEGLYEFPLIETARELSVDELMDSSKWNDLFAKNSSVRIERVSEVYKHVLSHQKIKARFIEVSLNDPEYHIKQDMRSVNEKNLENYAVPKLIDNYIRKAL